MMPHNGGSKIITCAADGQVCDINKITSLVVTKASAGPPVLGGGVGVQSRSVNKPASASASAFPLRVSLLQVCLCQHLQVPEHAPPPPHVPGKTPFLPFRSRCPCRSACVSSLRVQAALQSPSLCWASTTAGRTSWPLTHSALHTASTAAGKMVWYVLCSSNRRRGGCRRGGGGVLVHAVVGPSRNFTTTSSIAGCCVPTHPPSHPSLGIQAGHLPALTTTLLLQLGEDGLVGSIFLEYRVQLRWCCCRLVGCWTPNE
jgi:hypothetical protein